MSALKEEHARLRHLRVRGRVEQTFLRRGHLRLLEALEATEDELIHTALLLRRVRAERRSWLQGS